MKAVKQIRALLKENSDEAVRLSAMRFFKEPVKSYGVKSPLVKKIAKQVFKEVKEISFENIMDICGKLMQSGYLEEGGVACEWAYALRKQYQPQTFGIFENWVDNYISNWASCDTLCNHSVAALVEMYPQLLKPLIGWADATNLWKKRAAAVTLIVPARQGSFLDEAFAIVEKLLTDENDMVQKGYGWLLKAASEADMDRVFDYVMANKKRMPRTALRYAIEKMPKQMRQAAMAKHAA